MRIDSAAAGRGQGQSTAESKNNPKTSQHVARNSLSTDSKVLVSVSSESSHAFGRSHVLSPVVAW